jgi:hypothetical protein
MSHTPGEWYKAKGSMGQGIIISENTGENIAVTYKEENSDLVAAAPDLLEALERLVRLHDNPEKYGDLESHLSAWIEARNSIAKATETGIHVSK